MSVQYHSHNPIDLSVYVVLDDVLCETPEGMVKTALEAVAGGATVIQLRAPGWKKKLWLKAGLLLKQALQPHGIPLIIDDHIDIAQLVKADGVHVGQEDIDVRSARKLLGEKAIIGLSVGSLEELPECTMPVDYLGVGPVYATATKADAGKAIGPEGLKNIRNQTELPIVAIGGIKQSNCEDVIRSGADGVAVVSAICGAKDVKKATCEFSELVQATLNTDHRES